MKLSLHTCAAILLATLALAARADEIDRRTAAAHAGDEPVASPAATTAPSRAVNSREAIYTSVDGENVTGWLSWPAGAPAGDSPGLIVIHEWWGLNYNIRQTAERLAAEGYVTLAGDLYRGDVAEQPKQAMALMQELTGRQEAGRANLAAAYDYLSDIVGAERIGVIGWCLGGRWSMQAALELPEQLDAAVVYYGAVPEEQEILEPLQMPILGLFAGDDPIVPDEMVANFENSMQALGKDVEIHVYPDAKHAFANPSGQAYDPEAAEDAWGRTLAFLGEHLQD